MHTLLTERETKMNDVTCYASQNARTVLTSQVKGKVHVVNCPDCNPLTQAEGREPCRVKACEGGFVNVNEKGAKEIDALSIGGGSREDLVALVALACQNMKMSLDL